MPIVFTDDQLVEGLRNQDDRAINHIYSQIGPKVKHIIKSAGGSEEEANDIFQEGIIACYVNIRSGSYDSGTSAKFSTYLTQVCRYKWYDVLKSGHKKNQNNSLPDTPDDEDILSAMVTDEKYKILRDLIDTLGDQCKKILKEYYWHKEKLESIAEKLNITAASVKNGKYRCMQKLKEAALNNKNLTST